MVKFEGWDRARQSLSEELEAHLQIAIAERVARGEDPAEARAAALRELGNVPLIADVTRSQWGWVWLEDLLHDLRHAVRNLRRSPAFTLTALLTLAFGIGANVAVFQLIYSAILADLPVAHPEELVTVQVARTPFDKEFQISYPAYQRLRAATPEAPLAARASSGEAALELPNRTMAKARCELVSDNYFGVMSVQAAAGRLFAQSDAGPAAEWPAVLRYGFARDTFGAAEQAVGQNMRLNGRAFVVVGVAHRRFLGDVKGYAPDIWLPLEVQSTGAFNTGFDSLGPGHDVTLSKPWYNQPTIFWLTLVARVPAERRAATIARWDQAFRADRVLMTEATADPAARAQLLGATTQVIGLNRGAGMRRFSVPLLLLMALSATIFLVGSLNLANLQIARLHARAHELGVRMALGASRMRLLRQIVLEDVVLALVGCGCALAMGHAASGLLIQWASARRQPMVFDLHLSGAVLVLGAGLMLLSLLCFSVLPALSFMRRALARTAGSRGKVTGVAQTGKQRRRSNALLATQVGLSLLLSTMSACFAATLVHWETVDVGMDREHQLAVHVDMQQDRWGNRREALPALYAQIQQRLEALPGVRGAAVEMCGSVFCGWRTALYAQGRTGLSDAQVHGEEDHVGAAFFATAGIALLRGRDFSAADTAATQPVAIVSRRYARQIFGDEDPVGKWVGYEPAPNDHKFLIVGEVADARLDGPLRDAPPMVYMQIDQNPAPIHTIRVRVTGDPAGVAESVRQALHAVAPTLLVTEMVPYDKELNGVLGTEKLLARLAGVYAGLTLLMVAIGFYGVMSSRTARRRNEFGIRLALGASRRHVQMLIVGQTARILVAGILPGAVLSLLAVRASGHFLYGSVGANALAIVVAGVVLALAGTVAAYLPARRAALADPLETLRSE